MQSQLRVSRWCAAGRWQRRAGRLGLDRSSSFQHHGSLQERPFFFSRTLSVRHLQSTGTIWAPQSVSAAAVTHTDEKEDSADNNDEPDDEHIERFTAECLRQLLPRYSEMQDNKPSDESSLDLELGEGYVDSDDLWSRQQLDDDSIQEESIDEAQSSKQTLSQRSTSDMLTYFDPKNPPDNLEDLQLWLECEAQQEAVLKYQAILDSARDRKDYSSLPLVQRQVVRWFQPLCDEITARQQEYMFKSESDDASEKKTASKRYGPFLCTLPPAKLAVIVAHEAIMHCALKSGAQGQEGVPFVALALRLGEAVEEEVIVHRVLHKRFKDAQLDRKNTSIDPQESDDGENDETTTKTDVHSQDTAPPDMPGDGSNTSTSGSMPNWTYTTTHLNNYLDEISRYEPSAKKRRVVSYAIRRARQILEKDEAWSSPEKVQIGSALIQILLENTSIRQDGKDEMAFTYEKRWTRNEKLQSFIVLNDRMHKMIVSDNLESLAATTTRHKPMILPPKPWAQPDTGGYKWLKTDLMRYHGCKIQEEALRNGDLSTVYDGLNALGRVSWKINKTVLAVAQKCWENDIPLGDIPTRTDYEVPPEPIPPQRTFTKLDKESPEFKVLMDESRKYGEALAKYNRIRQKNMDLLSLRCSAVLKLDQAEKFQDFEKLYFPYNMDFRGRAYPIPPHFSNVGSDLCRGMLQFSEAKPLGSRGLYWLKVHLANFAGKDKMTFDDRAAFVDEHIDEVRLSAEEPFAGNRWWTSLEDPFQGLATCMEIVKAIDSGDPALYECSLPVHMDGSCNGLQHYAALGRDTIGGKAVNLCAVEEPQDVYVGVMHEVIRRVAEEADRTLDFSSDDLESLSRKQKKELYENRAAKLVNGMIDRGVVKRTVMTSVYGVTYIGARQQIQEKIESKLESQGKDIDEMSHEIFQACGYLALVTMDVIGDLFSGAKQTMNWLTTCARMISQHGYPVAWISPIGLPAIQPYRQKKMATLVTLLQTVTLADESDDLPIHKQRQVTAFPPNYVHSLDSSHMLLTALEMDRRGLTFSAVHDSFWTHPCDIDEMNDALREVFVELYDQPLLENLKETWEMRYPDLEFPELPKRGNLDLDEVKRAKYFFQ